MQTLIQMMIKDGILLCHPTFFHNEYTGHQSLKRFISSTINSFGDELDLVMDRNKDILEQAARKYKNLSFDVTRFHLKGKQVWMLVA